MKKTWNVLMAMGRPMLLSLLAITVIIVLMGYRLSSLTPGLSEAEVAVYKSADGLRDIVDNTVNAPYKSAIYLSSRVMNNILGLRLVNAVIGALTIILFYLFVRKLLRPYVAIGTTALFATTGLLLSTSRMATPDVMLLTPLALAAAGYMVKFSKYKTAAWIAASVVFSLSLYVPGMAVLIILGLIWQIRSLRQSFDDLPNIIIVVCAVIIGLLIAPLVISLIRGPELWRSYLGLEHDFLGVYETLRVAGQGLASLFVIAPSNAVRWLGRQPALDAFATAMFIYGLATIVRQYKLDRLWGLIGVFIFGSLLTGLSGKPSTIVLLLPFVYIIAGIGIGRLVEQWQSVFPRNPIARYAGGLLMLAAIVLSVNYQLQRYFVAWPNSSQTKQVFSSKLSDTN